MREGRLGYSTGACAAAAAKAALLALLGAPEEEREVEIPFPSGERLRLPATRIRSEGGRAQAAVVKDAGDDPDITNGALIVAAVEWTAGEEIVFAAGEGVGRVTKPGLSVPPGEPAINPGPRGMIRAALREVSPRAVRVTVCIPGGRELALKTFNPRLGIAEGLSILGTTGRIRPYDRGAIQSAVICALDVARACGVQTPVLVPGHIGERAARRHLALGPEQVIEVVNEWGFVLERLPRYAFREALLLGHPGKLAKLTAGQWDTHSSRSGNPAAIVAEFGQRILGRPLPASPTTEGIFAALDPEARRRLADALAAEVGRAARRRIGGRPTLAVALVTMRGDLLGATGDLQTWQPR